MLTSANNFQKETTFSIQSEHDLIATFRLIDQKKLVLPPGLQYPLHVRSYFTWKESSGVYTYLIFKKPNWDLPKGMVFKRAHNAAETMGKLCSWCNSYGSSDEIGMLSVALNANVSATYILCRDLSCIEKIEEASNLSGKDAEPFIHQLYNRMGTFFEQVSHYKPET